MRVAVIGAGLAGLALTQRLSRTGVEVEVYEQDAGPFLRRQGYRITADADGLNALRSCLPAELMTMVEATSGPTGGSFRITDGQLRDAVVVHFDPHKDAQRQLDRETLRRIMLSGLQDSVHYGWQATSLRDAAHGGAHVEFAGRESETFDFVAVADGIGSRLRPLVLPEAVPGVTGYGGLYGRTPLHEKKSLLPAPLLDSGVLALLPRPGLAFFVTAMRFQHRPSDVLPPAVRSQDVAPSPDYLMWGLIAPSPELETVLRSDGGGRLRYAKTRVAGAHPVIRTIVDATPACDTVVSQFSAGRPGGPRLVREAAVLGDAVHPMPPLGAHGGNTALRDAALLAELLLSATTRGDLASKADEYHHQMSAYATPAIRAAEKQLKQLSGGPTRWVLKHLLPRFHHAALKPQPRR